MSGTVMRPGNAPSAERRALPTYLVSARHEVRVATPAGYVYRPYAQWHARKLGSPLTLCRQLAVTWTYFWELRFHEGTGRQCPDCVNTLAKRDEEVTHQEKRCTS